MDVVPARCAAPDDVFLVRLEFHEADGTVAFDWLAFPIRVVILRFVFDVSERRVFIDFAEFLRMC